MITVKDKTIHLIGRDISYVITAGEYGDLFHYHFGKKLRDREYDTSVPWVSWSSFTPQGYTLEGVPQEYPVYGYADLRPGALTFERNGKNGVAQPKLKKITVKSGCHEISGMPCLYDKEKDAETAEIIIADEEAGIEIKLFYTVFGSRNVVARCAVIKNVSDSDLKLTSAYSGCLDLEKAEREVVYFPGAWGRERQMERCGIRPGMRVDIANERGGSGHNMNPFVMVCDKGADERRGEVVSASLIYSGNHSTRVDSSVDGAVRIMQGISPNGFAWDLAPGEEFETPQSVFAWSDEGFGGISVELGRLWNHDLSRVDASKRERPVLINNWEATYFDFDEDKLVEIAKKAKEAGIELFVMDDGWFGARNDDTKGLGDWQVNREKLPSGLKGLSEKINNAGLKFGIWIEPEMVNPDSDLYRAHPDWAIQTGYKTPALSRNQLILDIARDEVREYIEDVITKALSEGNIEYVKWDMNRPMTDMPYPGYNHRYTLALYKMAKTLTERFPNILFEGCSGGGGRFDAGMLAYFPQIWTSDNSDAVARLKIQYATSMGYPASAMSAHVTASPNHQNGRATSLKSRADVALSGVFGYELDITKLSAAEFEDIKEQVEFAKSVRELVRTGDIYRLKSPFEGNYCAWQVVSEDKSEAYFMACRILSEANSVDERIRLYGLDEAGVYEDTLSGRTYYADELVYRGYMPEYSREDFSTVIMHLKKTEKK